MKRATFGSGAVAAALAAGGVRPAVARAAVLAEVPFFFSQGYVALEVTLGSAAQPVLALLNTGFTASFLDARDARRCGLVLRDADRRGTGDAAPWVVRAPLALGGIALPDARIVCTDRGRDVVRDLGVSAELLLGFEPFLTRTLQIDYAHRMLRVFDAPPVPPAGAFTTALTFEQYQPRSPKLVTFDGLDLAGQRVAAQFDTLWNREAIIFPTKLGQPLALSPSALPNARYEEAELVPGAVATIALGSLVLTRPGTAYVPQQGEDANVPTTRLAAVVGNALFANAVVTLDFAGARMTVALIA